MPTVLHYDAVIDAMVQVHGETHRDKLASTLLRILQSSKEDIQRQLDHIIEQIELRVSCFLHFGFCFLNARCNFYLKQIFRFLQSGISCAIFREDLTRPAPPHPCTSESCIKIKINLIFYFHTSLWCHKSFYEALKSLHKSFWSTTKKCENKNLS